jgi:ABC-type oligopeptide transport system substrate-binding subunit
VRPGIYFTDDPAFRGQRRELVAADYVYSFKRIYDPATRSPAYSSLQEDGIIGLEALRERALRDRTPFDYRSEVEGIRALDRYTLQFKLAAARPRFLTTMTGNSYAAVAREVIEAYGEDSMSHPVGTGPYQLKDWRRSSRIVLEKNPAPATSATAASRRRTMRKLRLGPSASTAVACRSTTGSRSRSSRKTSRAG